MKKLIGVFILVLFVFASCATTFPVAGANGKVGSKVGKATITQILFFLPSGDAGIVAAAKEGGITEVGTVDVQVTPGFISTYTTIVTGE